MFGFIKKILIALAFVLFCHSLALTLNLMENRACFWGFDFRMRYNEVKCVLAGTDPLLIWNGTIPSSDYQPFDWKCNLRDDRLELVHSYPPWSYTYLLPLVLLPRHVATGIYASLEGFCALGLFGAVLFWGFRRKKNVGEGFICFGVAVCVLPSMLNCLQVLNYGIFLATALLGMIVSLNRGRDVLAGFCWAYMMVKPQVAVIFAIPLMMCGKWRTVLTAVLTCVLASLPPAILCGRSPVAMILSILEYSRGFGLDVSQGMPLIPSCVVGFLLPMVSAGGVFVLNALLGLVGCAVATWFTQRSVDWLYRLIPASIFCLLWTVSRCHDQVCLIFAYTGAVLILLRLLDRLEQKNRMSFPRGT